DHKSVGLRCPPGLKPLRPGCTLLLWSFITIDVNQNFRTDEHASITEGVVKLVGDHMAAFGIQKSQYGDLVAEHPAAYAGDFYQLAVFIFAAHCPHIAIGFQLDLVGQLPFTE